MASSETADRLWPYIERSIDRIVAALQSLEDTGIPLGWRPPAAGANSVYVLAVHALGNTEEQLLGVLCGLEVTRDREAEFAATPGSAAAIASEWRALAARIESAFGALTEVDLADSKRHPRRGEITGLEVLIVVARHMAEHAGQAELTRDLALAAQRAS